MSFTEFANRVHEQYKAISKYEMYETQGDGESRWHTYMTAYPNGTNPVYITKTSHDCATCRNFVKHLGGLVAIVDGKFQTVWDIDTSGLDHPYAVVAAIMRDYVLSQPITGVFRSDQRQYGAEVTPQHIAGKPTIMWPHFHGKVFDRHYSRTPATDKAQLNTRIAALRRGLTELTVDALYTVIELIQQNELYRGQEFLTPVTSFKRTLEEYHAADDTGKEVLIHSRFTDVYLSGFRASAIGSLVLDLSMDRDLDEAVRSFRTKMDPTTYQQPTTQASLVTARKALEKIRELGLESALDRRLATIEDVDVNDVLWVDGTVRPRMKGTLEELVLGSAEPTKTRSKGPEVDIDIHTFMRDVLPKAKSLSLLVTPEHRNHLMVVTAPVHAEAERLFKWDNGFAWSYLGGAADSIKERVKAAGGNVTGELCCRLAWNYTDDLDFWMMEPSRHSYIYYHNKTSLQSGGKLDVDANAGQFSLTNSPVENIVYESIARMPVGKYELSVNNYNRRTLDGAGFEVEIDLLGKVYRMVHAEVVPQSVRILVAEFTKHADGTLTIIPLIPASTSVTNSAGIHLGRMTKVNTVMLSPNYWGDNAVGNKHWFFILDGCKMDEPTKGFHNEYLRNDLVEYRKVFASLSGKTKCPVTDNQLAGIGFSSTLKGDKITASADGRTYNISF